MRENFLFKDQLFWFLEHTQDFEVTVSGVTRVKGLKPHLQSHFENLISKYKRLTYFRLDQESGGMKVKSNSILWNDFWILVV